jgi:hypothetical protein
MMAMSNLLLAGVVLHKRRGRKRQRQAPQGHAPQASTRKPPAPELVGVNWRLEKPLVYLCWQDFPGWPARVETMRLDFGHWDQLQEQARGPGVLRTLKRWGYM